MREERGYSSLTPDIREHDDHRRRRTFIYPFFPFLISLRLFLSRRTSLAFARLPGCFRARLCNKKFERELAARRGN